eukprot:g26868.t1
MVLLPWLASMLLFNRDIFSEACTCMMVTKGASATGEAMVTHTDDAGGGTSDQRIIHVPAADHRRGSKRAIYPIRGSYPRWVRDDMGDGYMPHGLDEVMDQPMGYIDQVEHTFAYWTADYGLVNEMGLGMGESTTGARTVGWPVKESYGFCLLGISELTNIALERCASARCAIETMGRLAQQHGFFSEDSDYPGHPGYDDSGE